MTSTKRGFENAFEETLRDAVLAKLNPRKISHADNIFSYLEPSYKQVYQLLENTFKYREGKSVLLIGPRGVGKTCIVESAIDVLKRREKYEFFTIRINGSFFKDDVKAIQEIARQLDWYLQRYNPKERETLKRATFEQNTASSTMNVIIDILDRTKLSEEHEDLEREDHGGKETRKLRRRTGMFIPVVFIIDEIDTYTHNAKQTLLYNLFDMAQSSSSRTGNERKRRAGSTTVTVLGISTKTTVREQLEKRVKSRFSQRIIQVNKVRELSAFCRCVHELVAFSDAEMADDAPELRALKQRFNDALRKQIYEPGEMRKLVVENFYTVKDVRGLRNELVVYLTDNLRDLVYRHLDDYRNRNAGLIGSLSDSELKLLICCCRARLKNGISQINFDMAFAEYSAMVLAERREIQAKIQVAGMSLRDGGGTYLLDRDAMQLCWERLCELGLLERQMATFYGASSRADLAGLRRNMARPATGVMSSSAGRGRNAAFASGTGAGAVTPAGVAVCGIELDDIVVPEPQHHDGPIHDATATKPLSHDDPSEPAATGDRLWIARWKQLA